MSLSSKSIRGAFWSFLETFGLRVVSVGVFFVLAILLEPEVFGLIALANAFVNFANRFVEQGLVTAIVQRKDLEDAHLSSAFWGNLAIGALFFALTQVAAPWIAQWYEAPALTEVLRAFAFIFVIHALAKVQEGLLQRDFQFKILAKRRIIAILCGGAVGLTMAWQGFGVWSLVGQNLSFQTIQAIILWRESTWRPRWEFSWSHYWDLFAFGGQMMINRLVIYANKHGADLIIGYFLGTTALGYFSIANKVFTILVDLISNVLAKVSLSLFSRLQEQPEQLVAHLKKTLELGCYVALPVFGGMVVLGPELIPLVVGAKWEPSMLTLQLLAGAGVFLTIHTILDSAVLAKGRPFLSMKGHLFFAVGNILLFYLVVSRGIEAVAAAYLGLSVILVPIVLMLFRKLLGFHIVDLLRVLGRPVLGAVLAGGLYFLGWSIWPEMPLIGKLGLFLLACLLYLGMAYRLSPGFFRLLHRFLPVKIKPQA
ncbi:MAG: lipopolysaccharide biosynthesis protein [Bacteroidota bacterium]